MRPSKYETHVKPRLDEVKEWRAQGWSLEKIADALHITKSTLCLYQKDYSEFSDCLKKDWIDLIDEDVIVRSIVRESEAHAVTLHKTRMAWNPETKSWDELKESWEQYVPANTSLINKYLDLKYRNAGPEDQEEHAIMVLPEREQMEGGDDLGARDMGTTA